MKRTLQFLILLAVFAGGYTIGQQPDSPDLRRPIRTVWDWAVRQAVALHHRLDTPAPPTDAPAGPEASGQARAADGDAAGHPGS